jgi:hypothetical protein
MMDAPGQNWELCQAELDREAAVLARNSTSAERFRLYNDLFGLIWNAPRGSYDWQRVDARLWEQKVDTRARLLRAYTELDRLHRERSAANHSA